MNNKKVKVIPFSEYKRLAEAFQEALFHLEFCNYGDDWENQCAEVDKLPQRLEQMEKRVQKILMLNS